MTTLQQQARALGDPTRHDIFRYIAESNGAVHVAELTEHFGFNHNAIRQHLAKLVDASLVTESTAAVTGRGRPRLAYEVDPTAESRWDITGPYERLALLLSEVVRTGDNPVDVGRRAGRRGRLGDPSAPTSSSDPAAAIVDEMAQRGFAPRTRPSRDPADDASADTGEIVLENCPFATAALADPDTICALHLGLAHGAADRVEGLTVDELIPRDPRQANCVLRYRSSLASNDAATTEPAAPGSSG